jgi:hypothetical protein
MAVLIRNTALIYNILFYLLIFMAGDYACAGFLLLSATPATIQLWRKVSLRLLSAINESVET